MIKNLPENDSIYLVFKENSKSGIVFWFDTKEEAEKFWGAQPQGENFLKPIKFTKDF